MPLNITTKTLITIFLVTLLSQSLLSQKSVTGLVVDEKNKTIPFANILILEKSDSTLVKGDLSDANGNFEVPVNQDGTYLLSISYLGYQDYITSIDFRENDKLDLGVISLAEGLALAEVQITARKPLFEQKIDRMVVNVASSVTSAGSTALEVLERSPGVSVNRQSGALSLVGKDGVVIMINGKVTYQPAESIVQMLAGMSSDNIESIELITTPPANFDAEGNAGFINIVLKSRTDIGFNGNLSVMAGYGEGGTGSSNLNLNYRKGKLNLFANYSFLYQAQKQVFYNFRSVFFQGENTISETITDRDPQQINHNVRVGADFELTDKTTIGVLANAYNNKWTMDAFNVNTIKVDNVPFSSLNLTNSELNQWKHFLGNINLEHKINKNQKININYDYLAYEDNNPVDYFINYFDTGGTLLSQEQTRSRKFTPISIKVVQADYENSIGESIKFIAGMKAAFSTFENDVSTEVLKSNDWEFLDQFTNQSDLDEKIYAFYTSLDWSLSSKDMFKLGLRYEHTNSLLNTIKDGTVVDRQFGRLFPSVFYSRTLDDAQSVNVSFSQRITRPTFNQMAPFAIFLDPNTFFFGNAGLQPAISTNYKVDYRYKSYLLSVQYSVEDSTIARFQDRVDITTNQQALEPVNLSSTKNISTTLSIPAYIGNWWQMQNNITAMWFQTDSYYEDELISMSRTSYMLNSSQSFILGEGYSTEVSGFYNSAFFFGRSVIDPIYGINLGFEKKFVNGSSLRFNIRDILNSIEFSGGTNLPSQGFITDGVFDFSNRTFSISYSTPFGNSKLKKGRNRTTGSEEERRRVE